MLNIFFKRLFASYLFIVIMAVTVCATSMQAFAQKCVAPYETITRLHHPDPGAFMVWNSVYGDKEYFTKFVYAISASDKNRDVIVAGEIRIDSGVRPSLLLVKFDRLGREIWSKIYDIPYIENIIKVASDGDGYVVVANISVPKKNKEIWIGFFDSTGKLKSHKILRDKKFDLLANDIQPKIGGGGWIISLSSVMNYKISDNTQKNASVFILDSNGNKTNSRSYILGVETEILSLSVSKFSNEVEGYIATGYFKNDLGKKIGWVLRLNQDLSMVWQKEFSRGFSAKVTESYSGKDGNIFVAADIESANYKTGGVWLAKLYGIDGEVIWQRYYMSNEKTHTYSVRGLNVNDDGLVALLMMANKIEVNNTDKIKIDKSKIMGFGISDDVSYAHLLTLNPQGVTISGDAFYYAKGAVLSSLSSDKNGRRIMAGFAMVKPETKIREDADDIDEGKSPLQEQGDVRLPDVDLSEKTKRGLKLLQKKISEQSLIVQNEDKELHHKLAKNHDRNSNLVQKGWVVMGDMPDKYIDKCN